MRANQSNAETENHLPSIDPALWTRFADAKSQRDYCRYWLTLLCSQIPNIIQGVLFLGQPEKKDFVPVCQWPEDGATPRRLVEIFERVLEERCGLLAILEPAQGRHPSPSAGYAVAYPIMADDRLHGVVAVEVSATDETQLKAFMEHLQWGCSWMELMVRRQQAQEDTALLTRLKSAVDIMADVLSEKTFASGSMVFVTEMATQLNCDRVSLAFMRDRHARIQAISHTARVDQHMNLIRAIAMAMDESVAQRNEILYPPSPDKNNLIVRDHEQLAKQYGAGAILTMPYYADEKYEGALSLERPSWQPFTEEEAGFCRSVMSLTFPVLETRRQNDRHLIIKIWQSFKAQAGKLFGPHYLGRKLLVASIVAAIAFSILKTGDYRISAHMTLEGAVKRVVAAPFDGYVKEAALRAGDVVADNALMCRLDDWDFQLERLNWLSKQSQYRRQHEEAMAKHDRAEAKIIEAQLDQASARLKLVESQLQRTRVMAPFKGIVLSGDLSQRLGGAVKKGETLFEVAPLNAYRVVLDVDERRITDVRVGQRGHMVLSALPQDAFAFVVEKITPIATARDGSNCFRVEAEIETPSRRFRPGMQGIGKIYVDRRKLVSIWTQELREWLRLRLWSWWP